MQCIATKTVGNSVSTCIAIFAKILRFGCPAVGVEAKIV